MAQEGQPDVFTQNIIACIWDFDRTLIPGNMQRVIFEEYGVDAERFWREVNRLPEIYEKRGVRISGDTAYLNHLLSYVRNGPLKGLNNKKLRELGSRLTFFPGLPDFFRELKELVGSKTQYQAHDITLEHYVVSTGLAEMVRGSRISEFVTDIYGCELIENPCAPGYDHQSELALETDGELAQIGFIVDNTIKTRFVFEVNKGTNKNPDIDVNASIRPEDRRIPIRNMLYVADGPSDIPVFSVLTRAGGKTYAVYQSGVEKEFAQNDALLRAGRIQAYGPADYSEGSSTAMWIRMHILDICERIVLERERALADRMHRPPVHLHDEPSSSLKPATQEQSELFRNA